MLCDAYLPQSHKISVSLAALLLPLLAGAAAAEDPEVQFDCDPVVVCRDITPVDFSLSNPDEKIIEATVRVSTRMTAGATSDLTELIYEIQSPLGRIHNFSPRTELSSEYVEPIQIVKTVDKNNTIGGSVNGTMSAPLPLPASAHPVASLGRNEHDSIREEMRRMPAKKPLIVSGTFGQRQGVFFKFKQSNQVSLEGVQAITCSFIVPRKWRGDYLLLSCRADGERTRYFIKGIYPCGESRFVVGLFLEGDREAKQAAIALAKRQRTSQIQDISVAESGDSEENDAEANSLQSAADLLRRFAGRQP
tara:strand:- start:834 stop:1751 length:918 start_codon:yes stop_codon:yes gene_type:complete